MSVLSLLTSAVLVGLVYGLSFLPTASLARPEDEVGLGFVDTVTPSENASAKKDQAEA